MATFNLQNRHYTVILDSASRTLEIKNHDGESLKAHQGAKKAIKIDRAGNSTEIDLLNDRYRVFYNSLIEEAWKAVEKELNEQSESFFKDIGVAYEEHAQDFHKTLNIVVIGNVSSGKSSLINALLMRTRRNAIAEVGVKAGVTTKLNVFRLDERVRLIDSPGLGDVREENSQTTQDFLKNIDVGILVVTGAIDASQKQYFDDLKQSCRSVFLVLNKRDEWDRYNPKALTDIIQQWKDCLKADKVYPVCTFGYDPQLPPDTPLDVRGVIQLREDIESFLDSQGKKLLLARHMTEKRSYALGIIIAAVVAVGVQAAFPGKAFFITATQVAAIGSLYYLYTGKILSKVAALAILPVFAGQAIATNVFLFFTSFIPPTGIVEVAAAITAISITGAMLASVNFVLSSGLELSEEDILKSKFREYREKMERKLKKFAFTDITKIGSLNFRDIIDSLI